MGTKAFDHERVSDLRQSMLDIRLLDIRIALAMKILWCRLKLTFSSQRALIQK